MTAAAPVQWGKRRRRRRSTHADGTSARSTPSDASASISTLGPATTTVFLCCCAVLLASSAAATVSAPAMAHTTFPARPAPLPVSARGGGERGGWGAEEGRCLRGGGAGG
eukprot:794303-Rhodomonas_salina.1